MHGRKPAYHPNDKMIGRALRDARRASGLLQIDVADRINMHRSAYCETENGNRILSLDEAMRFVQATGQPLRVGEFELVPCKGQPCD